MTDIQIRRQKRWIRLLTQEVIILMALLLGCLVVFALAADMVFVRKKTDFDETVFGWVSGQVSDFRTRAMVFISFLGNHKFLIPANLLLIIYFIFRKKRWFSIRIVSLSLSSLSLMFVLKLFFQRSRPDIPLLEKVNGFSFPSGHALMSVTFYGLLIYIAWHETRKGWLRYLLIAILGLMIILIGFSRIYLRVHYASDVIAGLAMGLAWLLLALWIIGKLEKRNKGLKGKAPLPE